MAPILSPEKRMLQTGWYGIPGGPESANTKVHVVWAITRQPICGTKLGPLQQFQFTSAGVHGHWVDCKHCIRQAPELLDLIDRLYNRQGAT